MSAVMAIGTLAVICVLAVELSYTVKSQVDDAWFVSRKMWVALLSGALILTVGWLGVVLVAIS